MDFERSAIDSKFAFLFNLQIMIKTFLVQRSPAALWLMKTLTFSLEIPKERAQSLSDKNAKSGAVFVI